MVEHLIGIGDDATLRLLEQPTLQVVAVQEAGQLLVEVVLAHSLLVFNRPLIPLRSARLERSLLIFGCLKIPGGVFALLTHLPLWLLQGRHRAARLLRDLVLLTLDMLQALPPTGLLFAGVHQLIAPFISPR